MAWLEERVTVDPATGCWEWRLARNKLGYGYYGDNTGPKHVTRKAHRLAFQLGHGHLPDNVLHRCDNPPCCNPAHLRDGSLSDNVQDMLDKNRSTMAKLTRVQVDEIRAALAFGAKGRHIARIYGVSETAVSRIKVKKTWVHPDDRPTGPAPPRMCPTCERTLPASAAMNWTYCSERCRSAAYRRRLGQKPRRMRSAVSDF